MVSHIVIWARLCSLAGLKNGLSFGPETADVRNILTRCVRFLKVSLQMAALKSGLLISMAEDRIS